jgi:hypothetical protein
MGDRPSRHLPGRFILGSTVGLVLFACGEVAPMEEFWQVEEWAVERELAVGSADDPINALTRIGMVAVDGAERVYATFPMERVIAVFSSEGVLLDRFGGTGEGPGEFQTSSWIGFSGDTLYALDSALQRTTRFSLDGEVLGVERVTLPALPEGYFPGLLSTRMPDGSIGMVPGYAADLLAEGTVTAIPILRIDVDGQVLDTLALISQDRRQMAVRAQDGRRFFSAEPLGDAPLHAFAPDGSQVVIVDRRTPQDSDRGAFEVLRIGAAGDTLGKATYRYRPERIPDLYMDSIRRGAWESLGGEDAPFSLSQLAEAMFSPVHFPPITNVVAGSGEVWLRTWVEDDGRTMWVIVDGGGEVAGRVTLPNRFFPRKVSGDAVWGMELDSLDVPQLVRYRIFREYGAG